MSGHNKWKQIKHKKAGVDAARSKLFSRLSRNITLAARDGADPQFNPSLKNAIEQAKRGNMPQANIDRAIKKTKEGAVMEDLLLEIYGNGGVGILISVSTDNKNRTISEIQAIIKKYGAKLAEAGSLMWSFKKTNSGYEPKFIVDASAETRGAVIGLIKSLTESVDEIIGVYPSINIDTT